MKLITRNLLIASVALFTFASCADQKSKLITEEITLEYDTKDTSFEILSQLFYIEGTDQLYTGTGKMMANDGAFNRWTFEDGRVVKVEVVNGDNVRVRENIYTEGTQIKSSSWYETGEKWIVWSKDELITREWHKNGKLKSEVPWNDLGTVDGTIKIWDEEGTLVSEVTYENGLKVDS